MAEPQDQQAKEFAEEHKRFLVEHRPDVWRKLQQSDPDSYLSSVGEQASDRYWTLMRQYQHSPEVKKLPFQERVQALQSRQHEAAEIVRHDLLHQPLAAE